MNKSIISMSDLTERELLKGFAEGTMLKDDGEKEDIYKYVRRYFRMTDLPDHVLLAGIDAALEQKGDDVED